MKTTKCERVKAELDAPKRDVNSRNKSGLISESDYVHFVSLLSSMIAFRDVDDLRNAVVNGQLQIVVMIHRAVAIRMISNSQSSLDRDPRTD